VAVVGWDAGVGTTRVEAVDIVDLVSESLCWDIFSLIDFSSWLGLLFRSIVGGLGFGGQRWCWCWSPRIML